MANIELATVLLGAIGFEDNNVNDTFRGQVLTTKKEVRSAVIKDLNLVQLCNELIAHSLASEFGLPIPDCYLGLARPEVLRLKHAPRTTEGSRLVFVSIDVKAPNITYRWTGSDAAGRKALLAQIANWGDLGHLYAFDSWIANIDRHGGNLLFGGDNEFWLIDHGHCFTGPRWEVDQLDPHTEYPNRLSEWLTDHLSSAQKRQRASEVREFAAQIDGFNARKTSENSRVAELLPQQNVNALIEFLERRAAIVPSHASKALGVPALV